MISDDLQPRLLHPDLLLYQLVLQLRRQAVLRKCIRRGSQRRHWSLGKRLQCHPGNVHCWICPRTVPSQYHNTQSPPTHMVAVHGAGLGRYHHVLCSLQDLLSTLRCAVPTGTRRGQHVLWYYLYHRVVVQASGNSKTDGDLHGSWSGRLYVCGCYDGCHLYGNGWLPRTSRLAMALPDQWDVSGWSISLLLHWNLSNVPQGSGECAWRCPLPSPQ